MTSFSKGPLCTLQGVRKLVRKKGKDSSLRARYTLVNEVTFMYHSHPPFRALPSPHTHHTHTNTIPTAAANASNALYMGPNGGGEATGINQSWRAVHFDVLHASISWAHFFLIALTLESLQVYQPYFRTTRKREWTPEMKDEFKYAHKALVQRFEEEFHLHIKLSSMVEGNVSRLFANPAKRDQLVNAFVPLNIADANRKDQIWGIFAEYSRVMGVLRSKKPADLTTIDTFKQEVCVPFGRMVETAWPQLDWGYYQHIVLDLSQEMLEYYSAPGLCTSDASESLNKYVKNMCERMGRNRAAQQVIDFHWSWLHRNEPSTRELFQLRANKH